MLENSIDGASHSREENRAVRGGSEERKREKSREKESERESLNVRVDTRMDKRRKRTDDGFAYFY